MSPDREPPAMALTRRGLLAGAASAAVVAAAPGVAASAPRRPALPRPPFRPPRGTALVIAGQWAQDVGGQPRRGLRDGYLDHVPVTPAGVTTYVSAPFGSHTVPAGGPMARDRVVGALRSRRMRHSLLHLSVPWVPHDLPVDPPQQADNHRAQRALLDGELDGWIDALADWCARQPRPILLRPGYEFNRFPGDLYYDPDLYAPGFRRIVRRFRARRVRNVAFVWASANITWGARNGNPFDARQPDEWDFDAWYPGDDYVDWFGFSLFFPRDHDTVMLREARRRDKPVLLGETSPAGYDLRLGRRYDLAGRRIAELSADELWRAWFQPFLAFVRANDDVVAGFHYIATDWKADPLWSGTPPFVGGDARLWKDPELLRRWTAAMRRPRHLGGDARLWSRLGG